MAVISTTKEGRGIRHRGWNFLGIYFPTVLSIVHPSGKIVTLNSRSFRKGKAFWSREKRSVEQGLGIFAGSISFWITLLFMIGSLAFALSSWSATFFALYATSTQAFVYFFGSIFFTLAATLQLIEALRAQSTKMLLVEGKSILLPERFGSLGVLSAGTQWLGTLLFNLNTFDAMNRTLSLLRYEDWVWLPNITGSILFLLSSYFAVLELREDLQSTKLSRKIVWINTIGSVAFLFSALLSYPSMESKEVFHRLSSFFTFLGAVAFFLGAFLLLPEMIEQRRVVDGMNGSKK